MEKDTPRESFYPVSWLLLLELVERHFFPHLSSPLRSYARDLQA